MINTQSRPKEINNWRGFHGPVMESLTVWRSGVPAIKKQITAMNWIKHKNRSTKTREWLFLTKQLEATEEKPNHYLDWF